MPRSLRAGDGRSSPHREIPDAAERRRFEAPSEGRCGAVSAPARQSARSGPYQLRVVDAANRRRCIAKLVRADGTRIDVEPEHHVERQAQIVTQCRANDVSMTDQRNRRLLMLVVQSFDEAYRTD